jgi:hypothetical protein
MSLRNPQHLGKSILGDIQIRQLIQLKSHARMRIGEKLVGYGFERYCLFRSTRACHSPDRLAGSPGKILLCRPGHIDSRRSYRRQSTKQF